MIKTDTHTWDLRFLDLAKHVSGWSKDIHIKVGTLLVSSDDATQYVTGYNGFPKGVFDDVERYLDKPTKHSLIIHAELNAILNARRDLNTYTMYSTRFPCLRCTLAIIQSGIKRIVCRLPSDIDIWKHKSDYLVILSLLDESGVSLSLIDEGNYEYSVDDLLRSVNESGERTT